MGVFRRSLLLATALAFTLTAEPATAAFPGKNGRIVYATDAGNIRSVKADGSGVRTLTTGPAEDYEPAFSQSARLIAFARNSNIWIMRANGSHERKLTTHPDFDSGPTFSPNGNRIVFETDRDGDRELFVMKADGSDEHRLTQDDGDDESPEYSADGDHIVFESDRDGDDEIYTMGPGGGNVDQLTFSADKDYSPSFAPNSNRIVFVRNGASGGIRTMKLDTSGVNQLTNTPTAPMSLLESDATYSPNGKRIAYRKISAGEIVTIRSSDGGGEQVVAGNAQSPYWGRRR